MIGGLAIPPGSFGMVLRNALAIVIESPKVVLRLSMALIGGLAIPPGSFGIVLRNALAT